MSNVIILQITQTNKREVIQDPNWHFRGSISVSEASNMKQAQEKRHDFLTYSNYKDSLELMGLFKSLSLVQSVEVLVIKKTQPETKFANSEIY